MTTLTLMFRFPCLHRRALHHSHSCMFAGAKQCTLWIPAHRKHARDVNDATRLFQDAGLECLREYVKQALDIDVDDVLELLIFSFPDRLRPQLMASRACDLGYAIQSAELRLRGFEEGFYGTAVRDVENLDDDAALLLLGE